MSAIITQQIVDALRDADRYWGGPTITYSIPGAGASWAGYAAGKEPFDPGYGTLSPVQATAFRAAIAIWDGLIAPSIQEVADSAPGQIRVAFTDMATFAPGAAAYAYDPAFRGGSALAQSGDVWIDDSYKGQDLSPGQYGFEIMLHELGHALGLNHPFEGTTPLPAEWDNRRYTIMSYTDPADGMFRSFSVAGGGGVTATATPVVPQTPMLFDVIAIQSRYGADPTTAHGDDTYSFSATQPFMLTIYDTGGTDVIDLSNLTRGSNLNLTPGTYSSIDYFSVQDQQAYWRALLPGAGTFIDSWLNRADTYTWSNNVAIAPGTVIEQVRGSVGADTVSAADTSASVWGGGGADVITGGAANDYLRGEDGNDVLTGGAGFDDIQGNVGNDTEHGGLGGDWVVGGKDNDVLFGDEGDDVMNGNLGNDTVDGGVGADWVRGGQGDDVLVGGDGDDWLSGDRGSDTLTGGLGADRFHAMAGQGIERILDFHLAEGDRVQVDPGMSWQAYQQGADTVVDFGAGDQTVLSGVQLSSLGSGWIFVG